MARKRLNKKLVGILSAVGLAMAVLAVVLVVQYRYQDPQPYLEEGRRAAEESVRVCEEIDAEVAQIPDPKAAADRRRELREERLLPVLEKLQRAYGSAYRFARGNREIRLVALTERGELYERLRMHESARKMWNQLVREQASHVEARQRLVAYDYERARFAPRAAWHQVWPQVESDAEALAELTPDAPWPMVVAAEAKLSLLQVGVKTDRAETLAAVEKHIENARAIDPTNLDAMRVAAQLALYQAESNPEQSGEYETQAAELLRAAIEAHPDDVQAYRNLYETLWSRQISGISAALAQAGEAQRGETLRAELQAVVDPALEELKAWKQRFPENGWLAAAQGGLMQQGVRDFAELLNVVACYEEAVASETVEPQWFLALAEAYYILSESSETQRQEFLDKAYRTGRGALYRPEMVEISGPRYARDASVRVMLLQLHTDVCCALVKNNAGARRDELLAEAQTIGQQLSDAIGADRPESMVALGSVALAKGDRDEAVRLFYTALRQQEETGETQSRVKLKLFDALKDSPSKLLAVHYGLEAMTSGAGAARPFVECLELAGQQPLAPALRTVMLTIADEFDRRFAIDHSYDSRLKMGQALLLIQQDQREQARSLLEEVKNPQSREWHLAWARSQETADERYQAMQSWAQSHPEDVEVVRTLADYYAGKADYDRARALVQAGLEATPDSIELRLVQALLTGPDPAVVEPAREREIILAVLQGAPESADQQMRLGSYYDSIGQIARGEDDEPQAREAWAKAEAAYRRAAALAEQGSEVAQNAESLLIELALRQEKYSEAAAIAGEVGRRDPVRGRLFEARLYAAQGRWSDAAQAAHQYLESQPVSVTANLLLTQCHEEMGQAAAAMQYAREAVKVAPGDAAANRNLLRLYHEQNEQRGLTQLDVARLVETIGQLEATLRLNPRDDYAGRLRVIYYSMYVTAQMRRLQDNPAMPLEQRRAALDHLSEIQEKAVQTCRALLEQDPSRDEIWRTLAAVVYEYARVVPEEQQRQVLVSQAGDILREGLAACPQSQVLARSYRVYLEETGQASQALADLQGAIERTSGADRNAARLDLARFYLRQGQQEQATEQVEAVLEENPQHNGALDMLAGLKLDQGNQEEAIAAYERADFTDAPDMRAKYAELLINTDRLEEAARHLSQGEQGDPESVVWLLLRGKLAQRKGDMAGAIQQADAVLARQPDNLTAYRLKAQALLADGQPAQAVSVLRELRTKLPSASNAGRLELAQAYWQMGQTEDAVTTLEAAVAAEPDSLAYRQELASVLRELQRWPRLEQLYNDMIARHSDSAAVYVSAADAATAWGHAERQQDRTRMAQQQYAKARELLGAALDLARTAGQEQNSVIIRQRLTDLNLQTGDASAALEQIETLLASQPENPVFLAQKAQALAGQEQREQALALFSQALRLSESQAQRSEVLNRLQGTFQPRDLVDWCLQVIGEQDQPMVRLVLARGYAQQGSTDEQLAQLQAVIDASDVSPDLQIMAVNQMAIVYLERGDNAQAAQWYERLIKLQPDNVTVLNNLAYLLLELPGREAEGARLASQAYEKARNNPVVMDTYALALLREKKFGEAETLLRRAIQQQRVAGQASRPEFHLRLGQVLEGLGRGDEAAREYETTLQRIAEGANIPSAAQLQEQAAKALANLRENSQ